MSSALNCLSAFLVLLITASSALPAEVATRGQREAKDINYGAWQKLCFKAGGAPTLCRTTITGKFPTGQMAVRIDLIERDGTPTARLQLFVPVGMYLQQPVKLTIDEGAPVRVPYTWCLANACIAADVAPADVVKQMEAGKTLTLETVDSNLLALTTSAPLTQFAAAHKGAPAKTLEQYVDE
ncbi:invasion associated locus B family protein [Bradyrhizobium sp. BR 10261]|uniref:invasion associated locus B family protein n=1 Tax=Bradyrhizobium sp. BR 10261 TaxID=2749992 RepID=UPI001C650CB2|nr:invasion associated locus B family protein [Bradyrhizobium sp. BR 10261]MBW7967402.1 invasion associated locus B family protein [Bradyrhizobium sp. BR 10261]